MLRECNIIFTYGISIDDWNTAGLISREIAIYEKMYLENGVEFNFITYGDKKDLNKIDVNGIKIYPIYKNEIFKEQIYKNYQITCHTFYI